MHKEKGYVKKIIQMWKNDSTIEAFGIFSLQKYVTIWGVNAEINR